MRVVSFLESQAAYFATLDLPEPLIKWGHPGNMAVVLFALGAYGCGYLGWQIRSGTDPETVSKASDLHPKLGVAMLVFFALGALGGSMSQIMQARRRNRRGHIMQGQPLWESTHFWTGLAGLSLLAFQAMLPLFFDEDASARGIHAYLGSGVLALFAIHLVLGLQLGLSG
eukprot:scaffold2.g7183.t1